MSRRLFSRVLALHEAGATVETIAARLGIGYRLAYNFLANNGHRPNVGPVAMLPPSYRLWTRADLARVLIAPYPDCPWVQLAQRLAFQYGETEALKRVNGYASERAAA